MHLLNHCDKKNKLFHSGAHNSISGLGNSHSIPSVLLSCISSSVHSLGRLLPTTIKLRMAKECCAGVMYLHSKNIMHCDIKSLNFLGKIVFVLVFVPTLVYHMCMTVARVVPSFVYLCRTVFPCFDSSYFPLLLFYFFPVTSNLTVKLADLGEARFFHDTDPRKLPR